MYRKILFIGLLLITITAKAHNADASTTMLVEKENGTWVLQISAALTAFQYEIREHFTETPYKTPEEFRQMVLEHLKNNLKISFNNTDISFGKGTVKLGHETKVVFEVFGIPSEIEKVIIKNTAFDDIHNSQSALLLFKKGFSKEKFVLNSDNDKTLVLEVDGNKFVEVTQNRAGFSENGQLIVAFLLTLLAVGMVIRLKPVPNENTQNHNEKISR
ncbi:hypothetical protein [uncultured Kriegella sp.]|uniref:hypothetical protein n=1 Tax=uncultured Kriegella sp. TaxID=1798910 RepID=UPI0030DB4801|tara:strand:+ start:13097 stop:13744 length:648 start_codon:yes stop_codon:yes gene_type:complete